MLIKLLVRVNCAEVTVGAGNIADFSDKIAKGLLDAGKAVKVAKKSAPVVENAKADLATETAVAPAQKSSRRKVTKVAH